MEKSHFALPNGTVLKELYVVEKLLGVGGFGFTYLAWCWDNGIKKRVAIKEFFISGKNTREGLKVKTPVEYEKNFTNLMNSLFSQIQRLQSIDLAGRNIVGVRERFIENGTGYYVMEYIVGENVRDYMDLKRNGNPYHEAEALEIMEPIMHSLHENMHANKILHLDIKPENIMLNFDQGHFRPVLIDFDWSKAYDDRSNELDPTLILTCTKGYSPPEQSSAEKIKKFRPEIDVYSLGATYCYLLSGRDFPKDRYPERLEVFNMFPAGVSERTKRALASATSPDPKLRTKSIKALANDMGIDVSGWSETEEEKRAGQKATTGANVGFYIWKTLGITMLIVAIAFIVFLAFKYFGI